MPFEFTAFPRPTEGRGASRRLRRSGRAPGIVYGGDDGAAAGRARPQRAVPCAAQRGVPRVDPDDEARRRGDAACCCATCRCIRSRTRSCTSISSASTRTARSRCACRCTSSRAKCRPAVKASGAIISHITTEVEISCLPKDLPEFIEVDLSELTTQHALHVSALKLPPGVKVVTRGKLDPVVAAAVVPRAQVETEEETAAARGCTRRRGRGSAGRSARRPRRRKPARTTRRRRAARTTRRNRPRRRFGTKARRVNPGGPFATSCTPWAHRSASSSAWAIPGANTKPRATTPASGSPTRSRCGSARRLPARPSSTAASRAPWATCACSSPGRS